MNALNWYFFIITLLIALINEIRFYVKKDAAIEPDEFATDIQTQCESTTQVVLQ